MSRSHLTLACLGTLNLLFYAAVNFLVFQSPYHLADRRASLIGNLPVWTAITALPVPHPTSGSAVFALVLGAGVVSTGGYFLALRTCRAPLGRLGLLLVSGFMVLFFLTSVAALPNSSSDDVIFYAKQARLVTIYHANPYAPPPPPYPDDPYVPFGGWMVRPTHYGPVWTYVAVALEFLAGGSVWRSLLAFRLLLFGCNLINAGLIWRILGRVDPAHRVAGLAFYGWNPIVVLLGQEHLDTLMATLVLSSVHLYVTRRRWLALATLTLSVLVKFVTLPLVLVELLRLWRRGSTRSALIGLCLVGALTLLLFLPFWDAWGSAAMLTRAPRSGNAWSAFSPRSLLIAPAVLAAIVWTGFSKIDSIEQRMVGWVVTLLWLLIGFMPNQNGWYVVPLLAVASLVRAPRLVTLVLALTTASLFSNLLSEFVPDGKTFPAVVNRAIWWGPLIVVAARIYGPGIRDWPRVSRGWLAAARAGRLKMKAHASSHPIT